MPVSEPSGWLTVCATGRQMLALQPSPRRPVLVARTPGRPAAGSRAHLAQAQPMQPLQVPGQADQAPLPGGRRQPTQGELPEAEPLLEAADDRLNRAFTQPVDRLAGDGLQLVGHPLLEA